MLTLTDAATRAPFCVQESNIALIEPTNPSDFSKGSNVVVVLRESIVVRTCTERYDEIAERISKLSEASALRSIAKAINEHRH